MKVTKRALVISDIRSAASAPGSNLPGNLLINSKPGAPNWFPRREWRNLLIGAGLTGEEPVMSFLGARLNYEEVTILQEDIDAAITAGFEGVKVTAQGREITYKKPGTHNINLALDWSNIDMDRLITAVNLGSAVSDFKNKLGQRRTAQSPTRPTVAPTTTEEIMDAPDDTKVDMPEIIKDVIQDAAGNYTNADSSALSDQQKAALNAWVEAQSQPA